MLLQIQFTSHVDMTLPFWGLIAALAYSCYYILQMKFQITALTKELHELRSEMKDLKEIIIKNFTHEL